MNDPHKPGRTDETLRVTSAGGWITEEKELDMSRLHRMDLNDSLVVSQAKQVSWVTINRVCGELAVSRSIGDAVLKGFIPGEKVDEWFAWPDDHNNIFYADLIIPDPEFKTIDLTPHDEFLVIASDGLWDVMSEQDVVDIVRKSLYVTGKTPELAASELGDLALRLGSSDNVTIVIVQFFYEFI